MNNPLSESEAAIDLEQNTDYVFTRGFEEGEGTNDDHGAFVPARSYLLLSDAFYLGSDELTLIDPDRPNLTGKNYVQQPLMIATAQLDPGAGTGPYFTPVTDAVGLNASPSYGLAVAGANHLTPVTQFKGLVLQLPSWHTVATILSALGYEFSTPEQCAEFADQDSYSVVDAIWDAIFDTSATRTQEEGRLDTYKGYTVNFWDAFLSPEYDGESALSSLNQEQSGTYVLDFGANQPKQVFIVRDSSGVPLLQFQSDGNLLVTQGELLTGQSGLSQTTGVADFVLKDSTGTIRALVCESVGDFKIGGDLADNESSLSPDPNTPELIIRDSSGAALFIIDEDGNLSLTGDVYDDEDL